MKCTAWVNEYELVICLVDNWSLIRILTEQFNRVIELYWSLVLINEYNFDSCFELSPSSFRYLVRRFGYDACGGGVAVMETELYLYGVKGSFKHYSEYGRSITIVTNTKQTFSP